MKTLLKAALSAGIAASFFGCLQEAAPGKPVDKGEINNSDPDKDGFDPDATLDKRDVYLGPVAPVSPSRDSEPSAAAGKRAIDEGYVGVIPNQADGYNSCPEADRVWVYMDDEDGGSSSSVYMNQSGWTIPFGLVDGNSANTRMYFCKMNGNALAPLQGGQENDYAVVRFGDACPAGSWDFTIHIDNEDNSNRNANSGNVYPMTKYNYDGWTRWPMCFFPAGTGNAQPSLPALTVPDYYGNLYTLSDYSVFARSDAAYFGQKGVVRVDEEDEWFTDRVHRFIWTNANIPSEYKDRIKQIFFLPNSTYMFFRFAKRP